MNLKIKISVVCLFSAIFAQAQKNTATLKLIVLSSVSVGWGDIYMAHVEKIMEGNGSEFSDTISFGNIPKNPYKYYKNGDTLVIQFKNSHKTNHEPYLPPIDGTISKNKKIWLITKADEKLRKQ